jgi:hypothetical protein
MADAKKQKYVKMTSPAGVAVFPYLNAGAPSKKYKKEDEFEYKVTLALVPGEEGVDEFILKLSTMTDAAFESALSELKAELAELEGRSKPPKQKVKALKENIERLKRSDVFKQELDDDDEETGRILISFKMNSG